MRAWLICLFCLAVPGTNVLAQTGQEPIIVGEKLKFESTVLEETREIWIALPPDYLNTEEHYPVMILTDGDSQFRHASASAEHLARSNRIPGLIVVGVLNTDRGRDFTPPSRDPADRANTPTQGGAANFQTFLRDELLPFIEDNYRTRPYRILVGHSLGGLFAMHTLVTDPETFNGYIVISPSLDWSNQELVLQATRYFSETAELSVDLFLAVGNEGGETLGGLRKIAGALAEDTPRDFRWEFRQMPEENHNSVTLGSVHYGLESIFEGWTLKDYLTLYEYGGIDAMKSYYSKSGRRFGYEREMSTFVILQTADELISLNRLDEAATLITQELGATPPSYFLNLLAEKYIENGDEQRGIQFYEHSLTSNPTDLVAQEKLTELGVDISALITTVELSEETLSRYTGIYQPFPEFQLSIYLEDSELYSQGSGQPATKLVPISESLFSVSSADAQIEFFTSEGRNADRLVIYQFGQEIEAPRIEQ